MSDNHPNFQKNTDDYKNSNYVLSRKASMFCPYIESPTEPIKKEETPEKQEKPKKVLNKIKRIFGF